MLNGSGDEWLSVTRAYRDELYDKIASQKRSILALEEEVEWLQWIVGVEAEDRLLHAVVGLPDVVATADSPRGPSHDAIDQALGDIVLGQ